MHNSLRTDRVTVQEYKDILHSNATIGQIGSTRVADNVIIKQMCRPAMHERAAFKIEGGNQHGQRYVIFERLGKEPLPESTSTSPALAFPAASAPPAAPTGLADSTSLAASTSTAALTSTAASISPVASISPTASVPPTASTGPAASRYPAASTGPAASTSLAASTSTPAASASTPHTATMPGMPAGWFQRTASHLKKSGDKAIDQVRIRPSGVDLDAGEKVVGSLNLPGAGHLYPFEVVILTNILHNFSPLYCLRTKNCYWFASVLGKAIGKRHGCKIQPPDDVYNRGWWGHIPKAYMPPRIGI